MIFSNEIAVNHALLFSESKRIRRYIAAYAARNTHRFSSPVIHRAFLLENDDVTKSWLALALGNLQYVYSRSDIIGWSGNIESADENQYWGIIANNLIETSALQGPEGPNDSTDYSNKIVNLIRSYHENEKSNLSNRHIVNSLASGDELLERWALTSLSNSSNFSSWELVFELLKSSENFITREWAAWAISAGKHDFPINRLVTLIESESNPRVREWLYKAIYLKDRSLAGGFLQEAFVFEKDVMAKEGILQYLLNSDNANHIAAARRWAHSICYSTTLTQSTEMHLLMSQAVKAFYYGPISTDDAEALVNISKSASREIKLTVCAAIREQLGRFPHLLYRSGAFDRVSTLLESEATFFETLHAWDKTLSYALPITITEQINQAVSNNNSGSIFQRAFIFPSQGENNIRIHQSIENANVNGNIIQCTQYSTQG